ncbi:phage portal protein [Bradyrhizobium sp. S69]|uniref:phage portal protein n=1 Tax=Bradyrhizobium sp. S69 TaxID=1641856 RepID=UPI00131B2668|nr:phage portal protein [Bradyrhizobium sp. S69]
MSVTSKLQKLFGLETKGALASPEPWLFELFGGLPNASGVVVTPRTAMECAPVHCAVQAISEAMGQLPVQILKLDASGAKQPDTDHPAYSLLHDAANDWTSAAQFREQLTRDALLYPHGGFAFINRVDGKPFELIRYNPELNPVVVQYIDSEPFYRVGDQPIPRQNILHIPSPSLNGRGLVNEGREAIGLAITLERHAGRLFANGARPSGLLSLKGTLTPDALTKAKASFQASHGGNNSGGTAVVPADAAWQSLTFTSVDAQFMEMRNFAINEIARLYRVPPSLLFQLERVTHTNAEQLGREFLNYCLMSWIARFEGEFLLKLFTPEERKLYTPRFQTDEFLRADFLAQMEALGKGVASRIINPNEARDKIDLAPYVGGEKFENPNTTTATLTV